MMPPSNSKTANRKTAERRGHLGEALAAVFLMAKLYRIQARRFKTPIGEIDLIASRFGTLVFVEVKTRKSDSELSMALQSVNQSRIIRAAEYYLSKNPHLANRDMRFDVIFISPRRLPRHIKNAFQKIE